MFEYNINSDLTVDFDKAFDFPSFYCMSCPEEVKSWHDLIFKGGAFFALGIGGWTNARPVRDAVSFSLRFAKSEFARIRVRKSEAGRGVRILCEISGSFKISETEKVCVYG